MPTFNDTYRIFGDEIGVSHLYIDVKVADYSIDGKIRLEDINNNTFHDVPQTNLKDWQEKDLLLAHSNMPLNNIQLWTVLEDMQWSIENETLGPAEDEVNNMVRELFKQLVTANRSQA